jgi:hypothetical protein
MIGLYAPRLLDSGLLIRLALLTAAAIALVTYLRQSYRTLVAIVFLLGVSSIGVLPGTVRSLGADLAGYGDICRQWNHVDLPDWFVAFLVWFDVGPGFGVSLLGMVCGSIMLLAVRRVILRFFRANGQAEMTRLERPGAGASVRNC